PLQRDVIAPLLGDHAETALDQREILSILPEQQRGETIVLEGEHDLSEAVLCLFGPAGGSLGNRSGFVGTQGLQALKLQPAEAPMPPSQGMVTPQPERH